MDASRNKHRTIVKHMLVSPYFYYYDTGNSPLLSRWIVRRLPTADRFILATKNDRDISQRKLATVVTIYHTITCIILSGSVIIGFIESIEPLAESIEPTGVFPNQRGPSDAIKATRLCTPQAHRLLRFPQTIDRPLRNIVKRQWHKKEPII